MLQEPTPVCLITASKPLEPDGKNGVWVLTETGVSHIEMRLLSVEHKANLHSAMDEDSSAPRNAQRH